MARGSSSSSTQPAAASADAAGQQDATTTLPKGAVVDAASQRVFMPLVTESSEPEAVQSTDSVAEVLAGNYSESIVNEVKKYEKAQWDQELSELDALDDIDVYYDYDFRLPPADYDAYQAAAKLKLDQLESFKAGADPQLAAKIAARKELVKNKTADDLRWLKHKAYYRGMQSIRAGKAVDAALADAEAAAAAPGKQQQQQSAPPKPQQQQQQQQRPPLYLSEDELLAAVSDPSEWETGWTSSDRLQHPKVLQALRSTFSSGLDLPPFKTAAQEEAEVEATWREAKAAAAAAQKAAEEREAAKQALLDKYRPYQAYTAEYLEQQRRDKTLASHRRAKQQAFWLSLGLALGSGAYRWWRQQTGKGKRRRGGSTGGPHRQQSVASSRRSSRPPTPSALQIQGSIAE